MSQTGVTTLAHAYHQLGFNVLPLKRDKRPVLNEWTTWQTQRQTIEDLTALPWQRVQTTGVGAITGAVSDHLVCIDVDAAPARATLDTILGRLGLPREYAWAVKTPGKGGGWHVWVYCPELGERNLTSGKLEGDYPGADHIELRWRECYTVLPGSAHESGVYEWANGGEMPKGPPVAVAADKLLHLATWRGASPQTTPLSAAPLPGVIHEGQGRNNAMTSFAGTMRRRGASPEAILAALRVENQRICSPPLDERELETIAESIGKYEPGATSSAALIKNEPPLAERKWARIARVMEDLRSGHIDGPAAAEDLEELLALSTEAHAEVYKLKSTDYEALLRDGVPETEYIHEPYFPKGARIWIWGATGSFKSLYAAWVAATLSRQGVRVSYYSEENPIQEELRRWSKLRPSSEYFRLFHRTGIDLSDPLWVAELLSAADGDQIIFFDSWTDLWSGDESDNRAVQQFDANVLKPLQARGVTLVILHHTGHRYMFSDRGGATAGRGASSLGQKADVTLEFKVAGDDTFTIVYGKSRIGGLRVPPRTFQARDTEDGGLEIVGVSSPEERAVQETAEQMVQAILTVPTGHLTTNELKATVSGKAERKLAALALLESDSRVQVSQEKVQARDGKHHPAKVWRPANRDPLGDQLVSPEGDG